ncbi:hypothetical protein RA29_21455 [Tateyamaria sp. ANG-S1]|nr:hypothetical protein RA29_21455 [Tateyamaria sp. ANG-S1]
MIDGRIASEKDTPLTRATVVARTRDGSVAGESITDNRGLFRINLNRDVEPDLQVEVVGAEGKIEKLQEHDLVEGPVFDFRIPGKVLEKLKPAKDAFPLLSGPVYDPQAWETIRAAVGQLAPRGDKEFNILLNAARCPGPPIFDFDDMLDIASGAILGNLASQFTLAERLERFAEVDVPYEPILVDVATRALKGDEFSQPGSTPEGRTRFLAQTMRLDGPAGPRPIPDDLNVTCAVPHTRWLTLMGGMVASARSHDHLLHMTRGLEIGFCRHDQAQNLLSMANLLLHEGVEAPFREALLSMECGPDDGPVPGGWNPRKPIPTPECDPPFRQPELDCFPPLECFFDLSSTGGIFGKTTPYFIASITPEKACAGTRIVIKGTNFGRGGMVCFGDERPGVAAPAVAGQCVRAITWTDTEIEVEVPSGGFSPYIALAIIESTERVCGRSFTIYRKGNRVAFEGGSTAASLSLPSRSWFEPGETARISWRGHPISAPATLEIKVDGKTEFNQRVNPVSHMQWPVPTVTDPTRVEMIFTVDGPCGRAVDTQVREINIAPTLAIDGVEITQGIQTYGRTDGTPDNDLATISGKDTIVRVYIDADRRGFFGNRVPDVTGMLTVDGIHQLMPINGEVPNSCSGWAAGNPFIEARPASQIDREVTDHTLNFRIPRALSSGTRTLRIDITGPEINETRARHRLDTTWSWRTEAALPVRHVRIRDDNATNGTNARPSAAEAMCTLRRGFDLLPTPADNLGAAARPTHNTTRDLGTDAGVGGLLADVHALHACTTTEYLWGLFRRTVCPAEHDIIWVGITHPFNRGMGYVPGTTCLSARFDPVGMGQRSILRVKTAHEIGHNLGYSHVPLGGAAGTLEPGFPNGGMLIDVAFDPFFNQALPGTRNDIMAYGTRWISGYNWSRFQTTIS